MSGPFDLPPVGEHSDLLLERLRHVASVHLSSAVVESLELRQIEEMLYDRLVMQLRAEILGHRLVQEEAEEHLRLVVTAPATWWDSLKRDVLPRLGRAGRWYLRRHPVRITASVVRESMRVRFAEWATFPEASIVYPKQLGRVHVMQEATFTLGDGIDRWHARVPTRTIANEQALGDAAVKVLAKIAEGETNLFTAIRVLGDDEERRPLMERIDAELRRS